MTAIPGACAKLRIIGLIVFGYPSASMASRLVQVVMGMLRELVNSCGVFRGPMSARDGCYSAEAWTVSSR